MDGKKGVGRGMEVVEEGDYILIATLTHAIRWAVTSATGGQSHKTVSTDRNRFEEKGGPKRNRVEALLLTSLPTPYR